MCRLSINLWASTSWNPKGLSRPVMGLLYLIMQWRYMKWAFVNLVLDGGGGGQLHASAAIVPRKETLVPISRQQFPCGCFCLKQKLELPAIQLTAPLSLQTDITFYTDVSTFSKHIFFFFFFCKTIHGLRLWSSCYKIHFLKYMRKNIINKRIYCDVDG
jgi:hypothetical protein